MLSLKMRCGIHVVVMIPHLGCRVGQRVRDIRVTAQRRGRGSCWTHVKPHVDGSLSAQGCGNRGRRRTDRQMY